LGNNLDQLRHPGSDSYSAEQVLQPAGQCGATAAQHQPAGFIFGAIVVFLGMYANHEFTIALYRDFLKITMNLCHSRDYHQNVYTTFKRSILGNSWAGPFEWVQTDGLDQLHGFL